MLRSFQNIINFINLLILNPFTNKRGTKMHFITPNRLSFTITDKHTSNSLYQLVNPNLEKMKTKKRVKFRIKP